MGLCCLCHNLYVSQSVFVFEYGTKWGVSLKILMLPKDVKLGRASSWRKLSALNIYNILKHTQYTGKKPVHIQCTGNGSGWWYILSMGVHAHCTGTRCYKPHILTLHSILVQVHSTSIWRAYWYMSHQLERSNNMPKISTQRSKDGGNLLTWKPEPSLWWWDWTVMEAQIRSHLITFFSVLVHPCHCWPSYSNEKVSDAWLKENKLDGRKGGIKPRCEPWMSG